MGAEPWLAPSNRLNFFTLLATGFKWHYENQYDKINAFLVRELPDDAGLAANLAKARDWLERERKRGVCIFKNQVTTEALHQFVRLGLLEQDEWRCSREAYEILWKNDRATRGHAHKPPSQLGPLRRVDAVVHQASVRHAIACFHVYPERLAELRRAMDPEALRLAQTYTDNLMASCDCERAVVKRVRGRRAVRLAFELIERNSHQDPDRRFLGRVVDELKGALVVRESGVRTLVERYLEQPCRQFVWRLGPDVFIPARFGALALETDDRYDGRQADFLHAWRQYRLCESLVRRDKEPLIKGLVRHIAKNTA